MQLLQNGTLVPTFFDLMGDKEDDMTAGLAYVLARSPIFLKRYLREVFQCSPGNIFQLIQAGPACWSATEKNSNDTIARFSMNVLLRSGPQVRDARADIKGDIYEGLLGKSGNGKKKTLIGNNLHS